MTKYKEILRLQSLGINNTRIAEACVFFIGSLLSKVSENLYSKADISEKDF